MPPWGAAFDHGSNLYELQVVPEFRPVYNSIANIINTLRPKRIVDLGCGTGELIRIVTDLQPWLHVVGVDSSTSMLNIARDKTPSGKFVLSTIENYSTRQTFDCITITFMSMFLDRPRHVVHSISNLMSTGAVILWAECNAQCNTKEGEYMRSCQNDFENLLFESGLLTRAMNVICKGADPHGPSTSNSFIVRVLSKPST